MDEEEKKFFYVVLYLIIVATICWNRSMEYDHRNLVSGIVVYPAGPEFTVVVGNTRKDIEERR